MRRFYFLLLMAIVWAGVVRAQGRVRVDTAKGKRGVAAPRKGVVAAADGVAPAAERNPVATELDQVVVTGVSRATLIRENPLAMKAVSRAEIERSNASNVIDAIATHAPGLAVVKTGPNVSKPFINGLGYNRVLTLYDGLRVETQQWGDEHGVPIDDYVIERAEVIKGPASLMYGSDAIAGVLSLFPAIPRGQDGRLQVRVLSEYQSNNGLVGNGVMLARSAPRWSWALRGSERIARNYTNPVDGRVYNTGFRTGNGSGYLNYATKKGHSSLNASWYDNRQAIPDGSRDSLTRRFTYQIYESTGNGPLDDIKNRPVVPQRVLDGYAISPLTQRIQDWRLYSDHQYSIGEGEIKVNLGYEDNRRREYSHPTLPTLAGEDLLLQTLSYGFRYNAPTLLNIGFSVGANGMYQTNSNAPTATDLPIPDYHLLDAGGYVYGKWKNDRWTLAGGVRYDARNLTPLGQHFRGVSGSFGATVRLSEGLSLKANIARGYRSPNITEIASNGLDPGAHIYYIGNRHFSPEFGLQEDAGLAGEWSDWAFSINLFNNHITNFIYQDQAVDAAGNPLVIVPGNRTFQFQQTNAQLYGGDAGLRFHPASWGGFRMEEVFSLVYGFNRSSHYQKAGNQGEYLPFIPPPHWLSCLEYEWRSSKDLVKSLTLRGEADHNWRQDRYLGLYQTETATAAYTLVNVLVQAELRRTGLRLQLGANNLFNTVYQSHLSRLQYFEYYAASPNGRRGIYDMGRNICIKAIWEMR